VSNVRLPPRPVALEAIRDKLRDAREQVDRIDTLLLAVLPPLADSDDDELAGHLLSALIALDDAVTTVERIVNGA
jgi:hypothetical protein